MQKTLFILLFFISTSHFSQDKESIVPSSDNEINVKEEPVAFSKLDEAPIFPGCEWRDVTQHKKCMNMKIHNHIIKKFDFEGTECLEKELVYNKETDTKEEKCVSKLSRGKKRIYIQFVIGLTGKAEEIKAKAPHPILQEEAIRVIKLLPVMTPGKQKGKPVKVAYMLPLTFNLD